MEREQFTSVDLVLNSATITEYDTRLKKAGWYNDKNVVTMATIMSDTSLNKSVCMDEFLS